MTLLSLEQKVEIIESLGFKYSGLDYSYGNFETNGRCMAVSTHYVERLISDAHDQGLYEEVVDYSQRIPVVYWKDVSWDDFCKSPD